MIVRLTVYNKEDSVVYQEEFPSREKAQEEADKWELTGDYSYNFTTEEEIYEDYPE